MQFRPSILTLLGLLAWVTAQADIHVAYETDFEDFPVGSNGWAGTEGWVGNDPGAAVYGIDENIVQGLGRTAFLGYGRPTRKNVVMFRALPIDPVAEQIDVVSLETLVGVQDSTNGRRDSFTLTVYNQAGQALAGIRLDNRNDRYGLWRYDGTRFHFTNTRFLRGELYVLTFDIAYAANTWSAVFDGIPLFTDMPFTATDASTDRDFGGVGLEWGIGSGDPATHGNNWLLVGDWKISTNTPLSEGLRIAPIPKRAGINVTPLNLESSQRETPPLHASFLATATAENDGNPGKDEGREGEPSATLAWNARANAIYSIEAATDLAGPWTQVHGPIKAIAGDKFSFQLNAGASSRRLYFRVVRGQ